MVPIIVYLFLTFLVKIRVCLHQRRTYAHVYVPSVISRQSFSVPFCDLPSARLYVQGLLGKLESTFKGLVSADETSCMDKNTARHTRHLVQFLVSEPSPLLR